MVGHAVLDKLHRPFVAHLVKEPANVRIQHPFHPLPMESHTQRIQRLVRAAPRPKPVRKALEVHLINLIENGHHCLLNDFVLQRCDAQRALPPVGLRYIDSSRGLCPVRTTVNPAVQIGKPTLQPGLILFPSHAIHPGRSLPLQRVKAVPEQIHAQMVEQSRESVPSPFPSRLTHTAQSLGTPVSRSVSGECGAMFSLARALPSPISAEVCPSLFDRFTGTMARSDSSATCRSAVRLFAFSDRSRSWLDREVPEVSRFSCMLFLSVRGFLDYAEPANRSRFLRSQPCCLPLWG